MAYTTFLHWKARGATTAGPRLVPVEIEHRAPSPVEISVGGAVVRVATDFDEALLVRVVRALPPGVASSYMRWAFPAVHGVLSPRVPSMVVVVVIPIGSPSPSSWSRRTASDVQHGG